VGKSEEYIYGASFGAGVNLNFAGVGLAVDYAYRTTKTFVGNNVVTVKLAF